MVGKYRAIVRSMFQYHLVYLILTPAKNSVCCCNIVYTTKTNYKKIYREIYFLQVTQAKYQIVLKFCTKLNSINAVLCAIS